MALHVSQDASDTHEEMSATGDGTGRHMGSARDTPQATEVSSLHGAGTTWGTPAWEDRHP